MGLGCRASDRGATSATEDPPVQERFRLGCTLIGSPGIFG